MERIPCVYIVTSGFHGTLYTGVTSNLLGRIHQHRHGIVRGFTAEHGCKRLVWFEIHEVMDTRSSARSGLSAGCANGSIS